MKEIKILNPNYDNIQKFINEYESINKFNHLNILQTNSVFYNNEKNTFSILYNYCPFNLEQAIIKKMFTNAQIVYLIYQIASVMKFIHSKQIIHRNLIPSNILISEDGTVKICGFEISHLMAIKDQVLIYGQENLAPELLNENEYDQKADVFSFGIIVFFMLTGGDFPCTSSGNVKFTELAQQLCEACWSVEPKNRPSFGVICDILEQNNFNLASLHPQETERVVILSAQYKKQIDFFMNK